MIRTTEKKNHIKYSKPQLVEEREKDRKPTESSTNMAVTMSTRSVTSHLNTPGALTIQFVAAGGGSPAKGHTGNDTGVVLPQL